MSIIMSIIMSVIMSIIMNSSSILKCHIDAFQNATVGPRKWDHGRGNVNSLLAPAGPSRGIPGPCMVKEHLRARSFLVSASICAHKSEGPVFGRN